MGKNVAVYRDVKGSNQQSQFSGTNIESIAGAIYMPAPQTGSPMTYMHEGRQYVVVAVSGGNYSGEYIAYALPANATRATQ